jgi:hypothetical protein
MPNKAKDDSAKYRIPDGRDPGEFLNDADLAEYRKRQAAKTDKKK